MSYQKKCVVCGNTFLTHNKRIICCSPECSNERSREYSRRRVPEICDVCGKTFQRPRGSTRVTCSRECQNTLREATRTTNQTPRKKAKTDCGKVERDAREKGLHYADIQRAETLAMIGRIDTNIEPVKKRFVIYD